MSRVPFLFVSLAGVAELSLRSIWLPPGCIKWRSSSSGSILIVLRRGRLCGSSFGSGSVSSSIYFGMLIFSPLFTGKSLRRSVGARGGGTGAGEWGLWCPVVRGFLLMCGTGVVIFYIDYTVGCVVLAWFMHGGGGVCFIVRGIPAKVTMTRVVSV